MGFNLHSLVRGSINSVHPEVKATLYRAVGQVIGPGGKVCPIYAPGEAITAQVQSEGPSVLAQVDRVGQEEVSRKLYLFSGPSLSRRVAGIVRPLSRGGDMIQLSGAMAPRPHQGPPAPGPHNSDHSTGSAGKADADESSAGLEPVAPDMGPGLRPGWWLVEATIEDFSHSGWVSVRATLQVNAPDFSNSPWWAGLSPAPRPANGK
jgi:hypothetical protein